jgi:hypothetical protein
LPQKTKKNKNNQKRRSNGSKIGNFGSELMDEGGVKNTIIKKTSSIIHSRYNSFDACEAEQGSLHKIRIDKIGLAGQFGIVEEFAVKPAQKKFRRVYIPKGYLESYNSQLAQRLKTLIVEDGPTMINSYQVQDIMKVVSNYEKNNLANLIKGQSLFKTIDAISQ